MSGSTPPAAGSTPLEDRVIALLMLLRADPPRASDSLTLAILRSARWQSVLRRLLESTGAFAGSLVTGVDLLLGLRRDPGRRPRRR